MSTRDAGWISRREMMVLAGSVAAAPLVAAAQSRNEFPEKGRAEIGPGIPVVTRVVSTKSGPVQGLVEDGIHTFRGVRYGAPPIGPLRFMPPRSPEPWTPTMDCTAYGPPAMQISSPNIPTDMALQMRRVFAVTSWAKLQNEDCLYLNVWTPGTDAKRRPVMVWIHGGGYAYGSGADPCYQGDGLARFGDVVSVSVNHRLNVFGYLNLADLMGPDYASSGTAGMQDLVLALQWVKDNIAEFGGDPDNVTIMGQSGGGAKVSTLLAMPSAKGLFHKAAIQSGPGLTVGDKAAATESARKLLNALGVKPGDRAALQAVPALTMAQTAARLGIGSGPIVDGVVLQRDPFSPDAPAISADVPILLGWCKDEDTLFTVNEPWFGKLTDADLQARLAPMGSDGRKLLKAIRQTFPSYSPTYQWVQATGSRMMQRVQTLAALKAAQGAAPAYVYMLTWETPVGDGMYRTPHCMEIPFTLYSYEKVRQFVGPGPGPKRMADQMAGAWVSFARTGRPVVPGGPEWPPFDAARRPVMDFNLTSTVVNDPYSALRRTIAEIRAPFPRREGNAPAA